MTTPATISDHLRNSELSVLAKALESQRARSIDLVMPAKQIRFTGAALDVAGVDPVISDAGVTDPNGVYWPTVVGDEGVAEKLNIPVRYLKRMREHAPELYEANVNGWLDRNDGKYLLRLLTTESDDGTRGVLRAFLSDTYRTIDNFDVLLASLEGIQRAGIETPQISADLTDRRMIVRVTAPAVAEFAPDLLRGYRSPFGGHDVGGGWTPERVADAARREGEQIPPGGEPIVFAGFVISNSETGGGAFTVTPRLVVQVCNNGLTITADALRKVHLGSKLDSGVIRWSADTIAKNLALITSQTTDAVQTFMTRDYVKSKITEIERAAGVKVSDPAQTIATVSQRLGFTEDQQKTILSHFIAGGQVTAGGVMQAITSAAQTLDDGDAAFDMEGKALGGLELAASIR